ncbi:MAG TPA: S-layer homology domain-containing protein [Acidimicrobiales bacterium]|nr:S-layer homology domain-containing protein [Acidimicrobiales bacterium]
MGPDGMVWYGTDHHINRLDPSTGAVTQYSSTGTPISWAYSLTFGPDGALWFTSAANDHIGRLDTASGEIAMFTAAGIDPRGLTVGADGNLWFASEFQSALGRITPDGVITTYAIPDASTRPRGIVAGPDGNLWFVGDGPMSVGQVDPDDGSITMFAASDIRGSWSITAGPDGRVWFTDDQGVASAGPTGDVEMEFSLPFCPCELTDLEFDAAGALWIAPHSSAGVLRWSPTTGVVPYHRQSDEGRSASTVRNATFLAISPDGDPWVTNKEVGNVTHVDVRDTPPPHELTDVSTAAWYSSAFDWGRYHSVVRARTGTNLGRPTRALTRYHAVDGLFHLAEVGSWTAANHPFTDLDPAEEEVAWAFARGIISGFRDGTFRPSDAVTRGQFVAMVWRLMGSPTGAPRPPFSDVRRSQRAYDAIAWATDLGLVMGYSDGTFRSSDSVRRSQAVAILHRLAQTPAGWEAWKGALPSTVLWDD